MTTTFDLSVDAGNISLISKSFAEKYGIKEEDSDLFVVVEDVSGTIRASIEESYEGEVNCIAFTDKKNETYYVGDACYIIQNWDLFLQDTDNMNNMPEDCDVMFTGGDGFFSVTIEE